MSLSKVRIVRKLVEDPSALGGQRLESAVELNGVPLRLCQNAKVELDANTQIPRVTLTFIPGDLEVELDGVDFGLPRVTLEAPPATPSRPRLKIHFDKLALPPLPPEVVDRMVADCRRYFPNQALDVIAEPDIIAEPEGPSRGTQSAPPPGDLP